MRISGDLGGAFLSKCTGQFLLVAAKVGSDLKIISEEFNEFIQE